MLARLCAFASALAISAAPAAAQPTGVRCALESVLSRFDLGDEVEDIVIRDGLAYLAASDQGLVIIDVTDPNMQMVGRVETSDSAQELALVDGHALVGISRDPLGAYDEIVVIDVSDPSAPALVGELRNVRPYPADFLEQDGLVYVVSERYLTIYDAAANPADPERIGEIFFDELTRAPRTMTISEDVLYLSAIVDDVYVVSIIDISNPTEPTPTGVLADAGVVFSLHADGGLLYASSSRGELLVYDIDDPASPRLISATDVGPGYAELFVHDGVAYLGGGNLVVDVSDPTTPRVLGAYPGAGPSAIRASVLFVGAPDGLDAIDLRHPPMVSENWWTELGNDAFDADRDVGVIARAYYPFHSGLSILDISDPSAPFVAATLDDVSTNHVEVHDGLLYIPSSGLLRIFDLADPANPVQISQFNQTTGDRVSTDGQSAIVHGDDTLWILDVTDPSAPLITGQHDIQIQASESRVHDGLAYVITGYQFLIFDLTNPADPPIGTLTLRAYNALDVAPTQGLGAFATTTGVTFIDITNPRAPVPISELSIPYCRGIVLGDGYAIVGADDTWWIDLTDPARPRRVGRFSAMTTLGGEMRDGVIIDNTLDLGGLRPRPLRVHALPRRLRRKRRCGLPRHHHLLQRLGLATRHRLHRRMHRRHQPRQRRQHPRRPRLPQPLGRRVLKRDPEGLHSRTDQDRPADSQRLHARHP